jgi:hypothetical protein
MLAVLIAKTVADALEKKGIYDLVIELALLPFGKSKADYQSESATLPRFETRVPLGITHGL